MSDAQPSFLDLPNAVLDDADVAVLRAPYEGTACYGKGTAKGPDAILRATAHLETLDEELGWDLAEHMRFCLLPAIEPAASERPEAYVGRLRRAASGYGLAPPFTLGLGGEHSVTPPILEGIGGDLSEVTIVQIDAHADLRSSYEGSPHSHACAMRRLLDLGVKELIAIGIRSAAPEEYEMARDDARIDTYYAHELQRASRWDSLREKLRGIEGPSYLTIDIDGLDLPYCPGTGTPMPGGLSWYETMDVLRALILEGKSQLFGADVTETAPQLGTQVNEQVAAKLAFKTISYRFFAEKTGRKIASV